MPRLKITIAYVGTRYCGWQIQSHADGRKSSPTIQGELEAIASRVCRQPIRIHGSGRTDSGVHADAQVAHFDIPKEKLQVDWLRAFNKQLPPDITVLQVEHVDDDFHARFGATRKEYTYRLWLSGNIMPPHLAPFVWACGKLNVSAMDAAARHLTGTHDFASFQNTGTDIQSTIRTISTIKHSAFQHNGLSMSSTEYTTDIPFEHEALELRWHFSANGFLKQMVRNLMGTLVACGRGKLSPDSLPDLIASADRTQAPPTAPAHGLIMSRVHYG